MFQDIIKKPVVLVNFLIITGVVSVFLSLTLNRFSKRSNFERAKDQILKRWLEGSTPKHAKFSEKTNISYPLCAHVYA